MAQLMIAHDGTAVRIYPCAQSSTLTWRQIFTEATGVDQNIGLKSSIELIVGTEDDKNI